MGDYLALAALLLSLLIVLIVYHYSPKPLVVDAYSRAIRFRNGVIVGEIGPGRHRVHRTEEIVVFDVRRRQAVVAGQEILTSDNAALKVSLIAEYSVVDIVKAATVVESYEAALYVDVQLAARKVLASKELADALAARGELGTEIADRIRDSATQYGVELHEVHVRDFMLAANLRNAYADVVIARQEGLAALERARGETAAVRNLANSAQLMERHPGIMQLRLLQAVEKGTGNRVVIALDPEKSRPQDIEAASES